MKKGYVFIILMIAHISMAESIDPSLKNSYSGGNQSLDIGNSYAGKDKYYSELESGFSTNKYTDNYKIGDQYNSSSFADAYGTNKDLGANITMDKSANNVGNKYIDSLSLGSGSYSGSVGKSWTNAGLNTGVSTDGVTFSTAPKPNLTPEQMKNLKLYPPASRKPDSQSGYMPKSTSPTPNNDYALKEEKRKLAGQKRKALRPSPQSQPVMSQPTQQMSNMKSGTQMSREQQLLAERRR